MAVIFFLTAIMTFIFTIYKQNTAYSAAKVTNPVFLEVEEEINEKYIMLNPSSPFALVPTVSDNSNTVVTNNFSSPVPPISSFNSLPDMSDMSLNLPLPVSPNTVFMNLPSIKAIVHSGNNNIAILAAGQDEIVVGVGQETPWGRVNAINVDSVIIGQEKILARQLI